MSAVTQKGGLTYFLSKFGLSLILKLELLQSRLVTIFLLCDVGKVVKTSILLGYPDLNCCKTTFRRNDVMLRYVN